ncbi:MAG: hypothetical protein IT318_13040 [Anaerolineales bacterium]|nr:hypothetical protein [Anaerolineales bacterium]
MSHDEFEPEDPLGLVGMVLPGEPGQLEAMAECLVEEYVRLGWDEPRLMTLFASPMFLATHRIYQQMGEAAVRALIGRTRVKWSAARFHDPAPRPQPPRNCSLTLAGGQEAALVARLEETNG